MKKQYVFAEAYAYNYWVLQYVDGKLKNKKVVSINDLHEYLSAIENWGYKRAYYEKELIARIKNLEEELKMAKERYQNAQGCFLNLSKDEAARYEELIYFDEDKC